MGIQKRYGWLVALFCSLVFRSALAFLFFHPSNGALLPPSIRPSPSWPRGRPSASIHSVDDKSLGDPKDVGRTEASAGGIGLYVHIPYCRRRCRYCNFAIVPIGPRAATETESDNAVQSFATLNQNYTSALLKELGWISTQHTGNEKISLRSIYFGGGTPSLAPIETLQRILSAILDPKKSPFTIQKERCEVSIEMDPGTFSKEKLIAIRNMGFNRISLGVQSFDDIILESLGRIHRSKDIYESLTMIQEVYGEEVNYSLDLITGLPGLSLATWVDTLETAVNLTPRPVHLSVYDLQIEQGTVFGSWYSEKDDENERSTVISTFHSTRGEAPVSKALLRLPSEEDAAFMYKYTSGYLRSKGFEHYEVSSYARLPNNDNQHYGMSYRSQHNQIYWARDGQWFAVGLGATSFVNGKIVERPRTVVDYQHWVDNLVAPKSADAEVEAATKMGELDFLMDYVLKRLRTSEGLALDWIQERFGDEYRDAILKGAELGIELNLARVESCTLRLKDPNGFLYSNSIISSIFVELENVST